MNADSHIDHDTLATLREVMEDDFGQLIETFLSDSESRVSHLQRALAEGDSEALRRAAHSLKGSCSNIGASVLGSLCQSIEQAASQGELTGLECKLVELQSEFNQVKAQLDIYR